MTTQKGTTKRSLCITHRIGCLEIRNIRVVLVLQFIVGALCRVELVSDGGDFLLQIINKILLKMQIKAKEACTECEHERKIEIK